MKKLFVSILLMCIFISAEIYAKENFFDEAKNKYEEKELEDSKFLFQRNIVFNPKHAKSYLYLAKIYNSEDNEREEIKYLKNCRHKLGGNIPERTTFAKPVKTPPQDIFESFMKSTGEKEMSTTMILVECLQIY